MNYTNFLRHVNRFAIQKSSLSLFGRKEQLQSWTVHDSNYHRLLNHTAHRDAVHGEIVNEIHGSVYRINNPCRFVRKFNFGQCTFFTDESIAEKQSYF